MARKLLATIVLAAMVALTATCAGAAAWTKLGTSGFTATLSGMRDANRIRFNSIAFDGAGRIYATAVNGNNNGTSGGLTIFQPNGTKIADVDLNALGYPGAITKLVTGGDGVVYGLQNWLEINWSFAQNVNRILAILPNGGVSKIWDAGPQADANRIGGMAVGADGNIYWTMNAADSYWKYHMFWRYNVAEGTVEEAPTAGTNYGQSETHRMFDFEFVGASPDGFDLGVIWPSGANWQLSKMSWTDGRVPWQGQYWQCNPGWGRDWITATAWDPVNDILWVGGRGAGSGPWTWNAGQWGTAGPPYSGWSIADLGGSNQGLKIDKGTEYEAYFRLDSSARTLTGAMRFKVDTYSGNYNDNTILNLRGVSQSGGMPWPLIKVKNGQFRLEFVGATNALDLGPLDQNWHTVYLTTDDITKKATLYWDGGKVFDQQPNGLRSDGSGWMCFGATSRESGIYTGCTATVLVDWVRFADTAVSPGGTWPNRLGWYLDGGGNPTTYASTNIMSYWPGKAGAGFFPPGSCSSWHANGNDPNASQMPNGGRYWVSAIACNPADGEAWMCWNGEATYNIDPLGTVFARRAVGGSVSPLGLEGVPEPGAQTVALGFNSGKVYALTCNMTTAEYSVYSKTPGGDPDILSIGQAKQADAGSLVQTDGYKVVTLIDREGRYFYIEEDNRSSGIKVIPVGGASMPTLGKEVTVKGRAYTADGEAVIYASTITAQNTNKVITPLNTTIRAIGGWGSGLQPNTLAYDATKTPPWQYPPLGLNTTGLLVRVVGKVVNYEGGMYVVLDDGSGYSIQVYTGDDWEWQGSYGKLVGITGVSSVWWDGLNGFRRIVTNFGLADIVEYGP